MTHLPDNLVRPNDTPIMVLSRLMSDAQERRELADEAELNGAPAAQADIDRAQAGMCVAEDALRCSILHTMPLDLRDVVVLLLAASNVLEVQIEPQLGETALASYAEVDLALENAIVGLLDHVAPEELPEDDRKVAVLLMRRVSVRQQFWGEVPA